MDKIEEKILSGKLPMDHGKSLIDEFGHNSPIDREGACDPKQLLGNRIRFLRFYREMSQMGASKKADINMTLWRHYEHGMKMPRQDRLEKIADVLRVPIQMMQPIDTYSPAGIAAILYNMRMQYRNPEIVEIGGETYIKIPKNDLTVETRATLKEIQERMNEVTFESAMECYFRESEPNMQEGLKEHARECCEKYKAYLSGNLQEELPCYDTIQAEIIADYEWTMKNQILMEYITELYEKQNDTIIRTHEQKT